MTEFSRRGGVRPGLRELPQRSLLPKRYRSEEVVPPAATPMSPLPISAPSVKCVVTKWAGGAVETPWMPESRERTVAHSDSWPPSDSARTAGRTVIDPARAITATMANASRRRLADRRRVSISDLPPLLTVSCEAETGRSSDLSLLASRTSRAPSAGHKRFPDREGAGTRHLRSPRPTCQHIRCLHSTRTDGSPAIVRSRHGPNPAEPPGVPGPEPPGRGPPASVRDEAAPALAGQGPAPERQPRLALSRHHPARAGGAGRARRDQSPGPAARADRLPRHRGRPRRDGRLDARPAG